MTTACVAIKNESFLTNFPSLGLSDEAKEVSRIGGEISSIQPGSITFDIRQNQILGSVIEVCADSSKDNWDGYKAKAMNLNVCYGAFRFIEMLPTTFPIPDVNAESSGGLLFEWSNGTGRIFSIIIEGKNRITYAGLFGKDKNFGTEYLGNELPKTILDNLQRLFSQ